MADKPTPMSELLAILKRRPTIAYRDAHAALAEKRMTIYPIMYGRAKALLGLVPSRKSGRPKGSKTAASSKAPKNGRRRRKAGRPSSSDRVRGILEQYDQLVTERDELRSVIDNVRSLLTKNR